MFLAAVCKQKLTFGACLHSLHRQCLLWARALLANSAHFCQLMRTVWVVGLRTSSSILRKSHRRQKSVHHSQTQSRSLNKARSLVQPRICIPCMATKPEARLRRPSQGRLRNPHADNLGLLRGLRRSTVIICVPCPSCCDLPFYKINMSIKYIKARYKNSLKVD